MSAESSACQTTRTCARGPNAPSVNTTLLKFVRSLYGRVQAEMGPFKTVVIRLFMANVIHLRLCFLSSFGKKSVEFIGPI